MNTEHINDSIISKTAHTAAISGLEAAINATLKYDPGTQKKLAALNNYIFLFHCTSPELYLYVLPDNEVSLYGIYEGKVDITLKGSLEEFTKLVLAEDPASVLINSNLELHGNSQILIELQKIAQQIDIDWEEPLVNIFGDIVGHQISESIRSSVSFGLQVIKGFKRQIDDYLLEESDLLPAKWETEKLFQHINQLSLQTERLEARINRLMLRNS